MVPPSRVSNGSVISGLHVSSRGVYSITSLLLNKTGGGSKWVRTGVYLCLKKDHEVRRRVRVHLRSDYFGVDNVSTKSFVDLRISVAAQI